MVELQFTGSHADIGRQRGEQLKYVIQMSLEHWVREHTHLFTQEDAHAYGRGMAEDMSRRWPEIIDEVLSTGKAAGISDDDMYAYVFRCWNALSKTHPATLACYNMACNDPERGAIIAGVLEDSPPYYLLETIIPHHGIPSYIVTWAGMPYAVRGMNKAGVAIGQASSFAGTRFRPGTHDFSFALYARGFFAERKALQYATTIDEAVDIILGFECASVFMIADPSGRVVALEPCGALHAMRHPDERGVLTGGTFESPELIKALIDEGIAHDWEGGMRTAKKVAARLHDAHGHSTMEWMAAYLQEEQSEGGWCHDGLQSATIACPATGDFWVSGYRPCVSGFARHIIADLPDPVRA
jgi:hypothetical protein